MWKVVRTVVGELEAKLVENILKTNDIPVVLQKTDLFIHAIFGGSSQFEVLVPEEFYNIANTLLNVEGSSMKYTPLYEEHVKLGAKIVEFAKYYMPLQYEGIIAETKLVRTDVGIFDVSHMGEFIAEGPDAIKFADFAVTNDFGNISFGDVIYTAMCNEKGGFVDDLLVYKIAPEKVMFVVNASNIDKDFNWLLNLSKNFNVTLTNISDTTGLIAVQGPKAQEKIQSHVDFDLEQIGFYQFKEGSIFGVSGIISRTGYTGEDGFELYIPADKTAYVWTKLLGIGIKPAGLGARDVLRLEAGLLLYGNDMNDDITPLEASIQWAVKFEKDFFGKEVLLKQKEEGLKRRLRGIVFEGKVPPRHEMKVFKDGQEIGYITSGTFSPTLEKPIAFAILSSEVKLGDKVEVESRGKMLQGEVVKSPFYRGSVKSKKK